MRIRQHLRQNEFEIAARVGAAIDSIAHEDNRMCSFVEPFQYAFGGHAITVCISNEHDRPIRGKANEAMRRKNSGEIVKQVLQAHAVTILNVMSESNGSVVRERLLALRERGKGSFDSIEES